MGFLNKLKEVASDGVNNIITSLPAKSVLVKQVASVNYENMLVSVNTLEESVPASKSLIAPIQLLNEASAAYNQSQSENKDEEFINYIIENIDADKVLCEIEPVIQYIPNGNYIVMLLRFVINFKNKKYNKGRNKNERQDFWSLTTCRKIIHASNRNFTSSWSFPRNRGVIYK